MAILRVGNDNRSEDQRLVDEAVRIRVETHRRLKLPGETEEADPMKHISGCEGCLKELREHAEGCADGKLLLEKVDRYAAYTHMDDAPEMLSGPYADDATLVDDS